MYTIKGILQYGKKVGWLKLTKLILVKIRKVVFSTETIILNRVPLARIPQVKLKISLCVREARMDDVPELDEVDFISDSHKKWLGEGYLFYVALHKGKIVSYVAFQEKIKSSMRKVMKLGPGGIWGLNAFTVPEYRGNKIYPFLLSCAVKKLLKMGYKYMYGTIDEKNLISMKVHRRMGMEDLKVLLRLKILGFEKFIEKKS